MSNAQPTPELASIRFRDDDVARPTVIVSGFGACRLRDRRPFARRPVADYLATWAETHHVVWLAEPTDAGYIDTPLPREIEVVSLDGSAIRGLVHAQRLRRRTRNGALFVLAYPSLLKLWPLFVLGRPLNGAVAVYIGSSFDAPAMGSAWHAATIKAAARATIARAACRKANVVIARGKALTRRLNALNPRVTETVPLTMQVDKVPLASTELPRDYFLYVGKLTSEKGLFELLEGYTRYSETASLPHPLVIAGDGPLRATVEQYASRNPTITYYGFANSPSQLADLYRGARMLLVPTRMPWEGVPRVIDEALACQVPVTSSRQPGIMEEFGSDISYFDAYPATAETITAALRDGLPSPAVHSARDLGPRLAAAQHRTLLTNLRDAAAPDLLRR